MIFGKSIYRLLNFILSEEPNVGPALLNKLEPAYTYMRILFRLEDIPSIAFLFPIFSPTE